jgi:alkyl sulfatase BDS1-like metallo-beta-lactamase superfamily hydrolase
MGFLKQKTEEQKLVEAQEKAEKDAAFAEAKAQREAAEQAQQERNAAFQKTLPRYEYQVKRVGDDKQKGLLGSQRMEQIFNGEGAKRWELVTINAERATFRRQLPPLA